MTFRQMELFVAVCEHKSMNRAAVACFVSQQSISKTIRELEEELGCQLLLRTQAGVSPTKSGNYLLGECRAIMEKKNFLCSHLAQLAEMPVEVIHLGMAYGIIAAIPYRTLSDFEDKHPYTKIEYGDNNDFYLESLLKKGEYDFCITTGVLDGDLLQGEQLADEGIYLCIPAGHPLFAQPVITMEDLEHQSFAMFSSQFHIRHNFTASCHRFGFAPNISISSSDFNSLKEIARTNQLLFIVPAHTLVDQDPTLRYYPFPDHKLRWGIYFVKKKSRVLSEQAEAFRRYLKLLME